MIKFIILLLFISACCSIRPVSVFNQNEKIEIRITKIQTDKGINYLYGIVNNKKIRIATFNKEYYKKDTVYLFELHSLKELLIQYNIIPVNYLHVDLSKFAIQLNDTISISLMNKNYKDVFLTKDIKDSVAKIIMQPDFK